MRRVETLAFRDTEAGSEISRLSGPSHYFKTEGSYIFFQEALLLAASSSLNRAAG